LREDAAGLREPHFFRLKMTVDDDLAGRITTLPLKHGEWAVRDAVERTFRGAFRQAQGVFVVHHQGGVHRPRGHPHVHVQLSPRLQDGAALKFIPRDRLAAFKKRWEREIQIAVRSHERRALLHPDRLSPAAPAPAADLDGVSGDEGRRSSGRSTGSPAPSGTGLRAGTDGGSRRWGARTRDPQGRGPGSDPRSSRRRSDHRSSEVVACRRFTALCRRDQGRQT